MDKEKIKNKKAARFIIYVLIYIALYSVLSYALCDYTLSWITDYIYDILVFCIPLAFFIFFIETLVIYLIKKKREEKSNDKLFVVSIVSLFISIILLFCFLNCFTSSELEARKNGKDFNLVEQIANACVDACTPQINENQDSYKINSNLFEFSSKKHYALEYDKEYDYILDDKKSSDDLIFSQEIVYFKNIMYNKKELLERLKHYYLEKDIDSFDIVEDDINVIDYDDVSCAYVCKKSDNSYYFSNLTYYAVVVYTDNDVFVILNNIASCYDINMDTEKITKDMVESIKEILQ